MKIKIYAFFHYVYFIEQQLNLFPAKPVNDSAVLILKDFFIRSSEMKAKQSVPQLKRRLKHHLDNADLTPRAIVQPSR